MCDKWYPLGLQLLDPKDESFLRALRNQSGTCLDKCTEVFQHWLDVTGKPTWSKILKALKKRSVNFPNVADKIENMLYKSKQVSTIFNYCMHIFMNNYVIVRIYKYVPGVGKPKCTFSLDFYVDVSTV